MISTKLLIIDSPGENMDHLKSVLRKHGYEVEQQKISDTDVNTIFISMPHIIFISIDSEAEEKLNVIKKLKENEDTKHIPIIFGVEKREKVKGISHLEYKVDDYMLKPIDEEELISKIEKLEKIIELQKALSLSNQALKESLHTVERQKIELEQNLTLASKIQEALIPKSLGYIPNCSFLWHFQPSGKVGGDIFDVFMLDEEHMGMYMLDVMGHGVGSSMLAVTLSESLILDVDRDSPLKRKTNKPPYYEIASPVQLIHYLNHRFPFKKYEHYFTIFYMILNVRTGIIKYVRGGHPAPILVKPTGEILELEAYGTPVGFEFNEDYVEGSVALDSGDRLVVYSDGLMELKDESGSPWEYEGVIKYFKDEAYMNTHHLIGPLKEKIRKQEKLKDDLTLLEMRWVKFI
ncbi:response regulator receiver protein [Alkaliphilus metalliredigens QYMF]|uniref:Stage 0 sporulation protein A homolog n=1 Tax=Alkaliphilus metalliredigens (strain QYMF) TaxID=293826 RepID=A6TMP3_ALKMQ|nr:SpoIIE family protein phosphatase [Alkaliphilus metalliredigens]ABR47461.1 response regulator receiver protein [Alkaliphilus metalliredigens QYMF]